MVGGHCIGVDPYYLAHKAVSYGHHPKLILSGREINDQMSEFVVKKTIREMINSDIIIERANILVMGITFKENCPDIRNTKIVDVVNTFKQFKCNVEVYDPVASNLEVAEQLKINLVSYNDLQKYDSILRLVPHDKFENFNYGKYMKNNGIIFDLKGDLDINEKISL